MPLSPRPIRWTSIRLQGIATQPIVRRRLAQDLTAFFESSSIMPPDELLPVNDLFVVNGRRYGMVKDWSPDYSIFINKSLWDEVGVRIPAPLDAVSYQEWRELSTKLTQRDGTNVTVFGTDFAPLGNPLYWLSTTFDPPYSLYGLEGDRLTISGHEQTYEAARFYVNWKREGGLPSLLAPHPTRQWSGTDWRERKAAAVQWGCWFAGMAESDMVPGEDILMLRAPIWGRNTPTPVRRARGV